MGVKLPGKKRVVILGAAGRDFHNFNVCFRDNEEYEVVCFTASQIPNISGRVYPPKLAGKLYPNGIPILEEKDLPEIVRKYGVDEVVLAYSDLTYSDVMSKASIALASGADFRLISPARTMIKSKKPVIAVCAVRTGAGRSTVTRRICKILLDRGVNVVVVRHPMPYGNLENQVCQRFSSLEDIDEAECTIEEREEYEPLVRMGVTVYAGVDYGLVLKEVEKEADVVIWDGGNNDLPFFKPDLHIVVVDPLRPGQEFSYPGEVNVRMADVIIINKVNVAKSEDVKTVKRNIKFLNKDALVIEAESVLSVDKPGLIKGRKVLVIEDAPTVTHGGLGYGAGYIAAKTYGAKEIVNPKPYAIGSIKETFDRHPHVGPVLPAMGYGKNQIKDLEETINRVPCDVVVLGTPADLTRIMNIKKPAVKVSYELKELSKPSLEDVVEMFLKGEFKR